MILALIVALLLGIIAGTITGLIPGIHINLVAILLVSILTFLLKITSPITLVVFIVAMAITHTFIDYIPSIFLGAPDEDSVLSILPGHKLLLKGLGHRAVVYTSYGSLTGILIILLFSPIFILTLPRIYPYINILMPIILIYASIYLIILEKKQNLWAAIIFILSGFLGYATLNININQPLLPLLTGLFGTSSILTSINQNTTIPKQEIERLRNIKISKKSLFRSILASLIASPFTAFLPGLGASQAAIIGIESLGKKRKPKRKEFLFLLGSINTIVMGLSFITYYTIQKTRTGASIAISEIIPEITKNDLAVILTTIIITGILAFILTIFLSKIIANKITLVPYKYISIFILIILSLLTLILSGPLGLFILMISTSLGIATIEIGINRTHLMGCLLIPTILYYLF